eukprot:CAMPEP_0116976622 /NCGR_PEP_ID=MMETSP0467-20121206/56618_1 /TAXON_ID=283647 /ORGANISM="Mesodinium pulex, Strain SPMC105" /LENGTH=77 /DNA_ID=CAMNT_0004669481 /DNA_START=301 /DNA_END=534 /DNA_ORIENTATION=+
MMQHLDSINAEIGLENGEMLRHICICMKNKEIKDGSCSECKSKVFYLDNVYETCRKYSEYIQLSENVEKEKEVEMTK